MAADQKDAWDSDLNLVPVVSKHQVQGGALRDEASGVVESSGLLRLNTEGSEASDRVAEDSGFKNKNYTFRFFADPIKEVVVGYVVDFTTQGAMGIRRSQDGKLIALHLGGVFKEHPSMRPKGRRECPVSARKDSQGQPCLLISLGIALAKIKGKKDGSSAPAPKSEAESNI